jgi:uncharacterized BrkB/YihY/UPF0761 family membrane protein
VPLGLVVAALLSFWIRWPFQTYRALGKAARLLVWLYVISRLITCAAFLNSMLRLRKNEANAAAASNLGT